MMVYDTFAKRVTLDNKLILNNLASNMMLFLKTEQNDHMHESYLSLSQKTVTLF